MAIAIGSNSTVFNKSASGSTTLSFSITVSGTNTYLLVPIADLSGDSVTSVVWDSGGTNQTMTQLTKVSRGPANVGSLQTYWYGVAAPVAGTKTLLITRTGTAAWIEGGYILLTGALQTTTPIDATKTQQGATTGSPKSDAFSSNTPTNNDAVFIFTIDDNGAVDFTGGTGGTSLFIGNGSGFGNGFNVARSTTFPYTPVGTSSISWTQNSGGDWSDMMIAIAPSGGGPVINNGLLDFF